jgi:D-glycero-D-manno-heptose 1,7-bisphosphate phosphatase
VRPAQPPDVFIDRDGVVIRSRPDYVKSWDDVEVLPGALDGIARLCGAGHRMMIVTNQSALERGLISEEQLDAIHLGLHRLIEAAGGRITRFFVCPHHPRAGCPCRKPRPGLLYQARQQEGSMLASSYVIGDQLCDLEAAWAVGSRPILVLSGETSVPPALARLDYLQAPDLAAAADLVLESPVRAV